MTVSFDIPTGKKWISVFSVLRLFASTDGSKPGKQVGLGVPFDILLPAPTKPLAVEVRGEECVLSWIPPALEELEGQEPIDYIVTAIPDVETFEETTGTNSTADK
jgi:hypothetical protein